MSLQLSHGHLIVPSPTESSYQPNGRICRKGPSRKSLRIHRDKVAKDSTIKPCSYRDDSLRGVVLYRKLGEFYFVWVYIGNLTKEVRLCSAFEKN